MKKYLYIFIISMIPLIELRGAIPIAAGFGLPLIESYIVAVIGNMIPVPFIYFFAKKTLLWGKNIRFFSSFCNWILEKGNKASNKIMNSKAKNGIFLAILLFVGIPLPGTGAWTGTLACSLLNLDFKKSSIAVMLGVLLAGVIMLLGSLGIINIIR